MERKGVFTRDPQVEEMAQEKLHYSMEEVKRKTITQLQKELNALRKSNTKDSGNVNNNNNNRVNDDDYEEDDNDDDDNTSPPESKKSQKLKSRSAEDGKKTPPHKHIGGAYIHSLKKLYEQKRAMFSLLEEDSDFDDEDLQDWEDSLHRLKAEIQNYSRRYEQELLERWERKREKLKQLEDEGLIDEQLGVKWSRKLERGTGRPFKTPSNK
jgi:hypothetical protein